MIVEADGGSRGNPGPAAYGTLLREAESGTILAEANERIGQATNNVAEYRGLIAGLELAAREATGAAIEVRMDSKLVVEQMAGRWKVKNADLRSLALQARRLAPDDTVWTWVPRGENGRADALVNAALDEPASTGVRVSDQEAAGNSEAAGSEAAGGPERQVTADPTARLVGWDANLGTPTTFVLLRHGESAHTREKRFSGRGGDDPALTSEGRAQAEAAAKALAGWRGIDAVVSSPLRRAAETARIAAETLGLAVETDEDLAECAFGDWDGLTFAEVRDRWPEESRSWLGSPAVAPPGGESFEEVSARVRRARDRILAARGEQRILVVAHVTPIKLLVRMALEAPAHVLYRMELAPASLSEVQWYPSGTASLRSFSLTAHLPDAAALAGL